MDITSLKAGTLNLTVSHTDLAGNGASATSTATRTDVVILTLTDPSDIDEDNEDSYSVSGTCSQEGERYYSECWISESSFCPNMYKFDLGSDGT